MHWPNVFVLLYGEWLGMHKKSKLVRTMKPNQDN